LLILHAEFINRLQTVLGVSQKLIQFDIPGDIPGAAAPVL